MNTLHAKPLVAAPILVVTVLKQCDLHHQQQTERGLATTVRQLVSALILNKFSPLDSSRRLEEVVCWVVSRREKWDPVLSLSRMVFFFSFDIDLEHSEVP